MREGRRWWVALAVALLAVVAYWPALQAGWIWDDDSYVTANTVVQTPEGIVDAWVPGRTPQYYPLVFVSFWTQHALHGMNPMGFHLVNLLLHLGSSLLLWRLLRALGVPGAGIAAVVFALHPMQVESVAWVTERKNTLSLFFALGSVRAWLRFADDPRGFTAKAGWWGLSLCLFLLAMLSKTTAVAVPVAIVVVELWRRRAGRGRTLALVAPYFALGIALAAVTVFVEATQVGASGTEFERSAVDRLLQASMAWWFYIRTWAFPNDLLFIYPPFKMGALQLRAWAALLGLAIVLVAAVRRWRRGERGRLLLLVLYTAGVFPALGFINVYPLRYAPVADHFAYVGSVAMAIGTGWLVAVLWRRLRTRGVPALAGPAVAVIVACSFAALVNAQTRDYADASTLWRATLERNPQAWIAANNLCHEALLQAQEAIERGDDEGRDRLIAQASALAEQAERSGGHIDMPLLGNLSEVRRLQGRYPEAMEAIDRAIALQPRFGGTHWQRGRLLELMNRFGEAGAEYEQAVQGDPTNVAYLREQARWLVKAGQLGRAREVAGRIAQLDPADPEALSNYGTLSLELGDALTARRALEAALLVAQEPFATVVAVRLADACLKPPVDPGSAARAVKLAEAIVFTTGEKDPLSLMLLARACAYAGQADRARTALARAEALLPTADEQVRHACAREREAAMEALAAHPDAQGK